MHLAIKLCYIMCIPQGACSQKSFSADVMDVNELLLLEL
jgi:hypothetical protein